MQHLTILPILIPLIIGALMLLPPLSKSIQFRRIASIFTMLCLLMTSIFMLVTVVQDGTQMYVLGDWQPPFGIVLVSDHLSTLLVLLTSFLGLACILYACAGHDKKGEYFHPLFVFQIMGINGAFLTGDIFNLFVFFEILLIASYALLIHGGGKSKTQSALHYVVLNLVGSSLFLFGLGILYGTLGTLNIADMALKIGLLTGGEAILAKTGGLLLLVVFGLKSAMLPLHFWLPKTYASASAPVAALFAIMTKVGIYSIFRVHTVVFGDNAGEVANVAIPWLWPLALLTVVIGTLGVLASQGLKQMTANLVIVSAGTLLITAAIHSEMATAAAFYYLVHSTLVTGGMFLLADLIARQRGQAEDRFVRSKALAQPRLIAFAFAIVALTFIGMPPFSGFIGKIMVLKAAVSTAEIIWIWPILLISSLAALIAFSRSASTIFWRVSGKNNSGEKAHPLEVIGVSLLLLSSPMLVLFGNISTEYVLQAAENLHSVQRSVYALLPGAGL